MHFFFLESLVYAYQYNLLLNHGIGIKAPSIPSHVLLGNHSPLPSELLFQKVRLDIPVMSQLMFYLPLFAFRRYSLCEELHHPLIEHRSEPLTNLLLLQQLSMRYAKLLYHHQS